MITLNLPIKPYWIDLGMAVRVKVRPCTSAVFYQAKTYMQQQIQQLGEAYQANQKSKKPKDDLPNVEDDLVREALASQYLTTGLAMAGIIEWQGVLNNDDTNDTLAPLTPDNIKQLFDAHWVIAESFGQHYTGVRELLEHEKNALGSACNGTSAVDQSIATDVQTGKAPAPVAS